MTVFHYIPYNDRALADAFSQLPLFTADVASEGREILKTTMVVLFLSSTILRSYIVSLIYI